MSAKGPYPLSNLEFFIPRGVFASGLVIRLSSRVSGRLQRGLCLYH